ncbi:MAG TPA: GNAT family protein [Ktedonobacterales bacterium]|nr:GNAT family protein [Ktedonobacterales bacterium]
MTIDAAFTNIPTLSTKRLRLREIRPDDAQAIFAIYSDEEAMRYYNEPFQSLAEAEAYIILRRDDYVQRREIRWGITRDGDDRIIGSCGLHHFDEGYYEGYYRAETGYILHRDYWGQGFMAEALSAVLTYGFTEMALHRIEAVIDIANERSKNLLLKLGFQYEGNLRQRFLFRGNFEDEHYFGLLRDEWRPKA